MGDYSIDPDEGFDRAPGYYSEPACDDNAWLECPSCGEMEMELTAEGVCKHCAARLDIEPPDIED